MNKKKKIVSVVGARPNFVKLAPIYKALHNFSSSPSSSSSLTSDLTIEHTIIHTGQHYDYNLSKIFFKEFGIPEPDFNLDVGSGTPGFQIGEMIKRIEKALLDNSNNNNNNRNNKKSSNNDNNDIDIDLVLVYGDTNSTFAGALAAKNLGIKVAHVESGLRSFDRRMPEEINRVLTDHISDYLFAPTQTAVKNLEKEHVYGKVIYTGDLAVEIVSEAIRLLEATRTTTTGTSSMSTSSSSTSHSILNYLKLDPKSYILFTMHRSENTSSEESLTSVIRAFEMLSGQTKLEGWERRAEEVHTKEGGKGEETNIKIVFPIHPRTAKLVKAQNLYDRLENCKNLKLIEPVGYLDFIKLMQNAKKIITDSGGIQKEAYLLSVPCITIRKNTEWVETVNEGWNILTDTDTNRIVQATREWMSLPDPSKQNKSIFGDGRTSAIIRDFIIA
jgi:UDP-N-acetylglucosamine 2-epimerase (non-hydrolysing)